METNDIVWPERDTALARALHDVTPDRLTARDIAPRDESDDTNETAGHSTKIHVVASRPDARGLLRLFRVSEPGVDEVSLALGVRLALMRAAAGFEPNAMYTSSWHINPSEDRFVRTDEGIVRERDEWSPPQDAEIFTGMPIRIPTPEETPDEPRGTIIHFNGMLSTKYERRAIDRLRDAGWAIVGIDTRTSVRGREAEITIRRATGRGTTTLDGLSADEQRARLQKYADLANPPYRRGPFVLNARGDAPRMGEEIAREIDDLLAEHAYAAEAVLDYIADRRPDLRPPYIVAGFSAGALVSPTVALRLRDRIDALLIVSPAADLFATSRESSLDAVRMDVNAKNGGEIPPETIDVIADRYRASTKLDPLVIAPMLTDIPTLVVYADGDTWVPAARTEELIDRLARPDRLIHSGDHVSLFLFLQGQMGRVTRWLDEHAKQHPAEDSE